MTLYDLDKLHELLLEYVHPLEGWRIQQRQEGDDDAFEAELTKKIEHARAVLADLERLRETTWVSLPAATRDVLLRLKRA